MSETDTSLYDGPCEAGCQHFHGGEVRHHPDCGHYPESLTKVNDDNISALLARAEKAETERDAAHAAGYAQGLRGVGRNAYEAGARAVHDEWVRAHGAGEGPPRGEPDFSEAATDYAASLLPADIPAPEPAVTVPEAAKVLIPALEKEHIKYIASLGRDPDEYTSLYSSAIRALRTLTRKDTP